MKEVQDRNGNIRQVPINTPCHAGINGALPVMLDEVLDAAIFAEVEARNIAWEAGRAKRDALNEITRLENQITERRKREAILGTDNGWLANQESLIAIERAKL